MGEAYKDKLDTDDEAAAEAPKTPVARLPWNETMYFHYVNSFLLDPNRRISGCPLEDEERGLLALLLSKQEQRTEHSRQTVWTSNTPWLYHENDVRIFLAETLLESHSSANQRRLPRVPLDYMKSLEYLSPVYELHHKVLRKLVTWTFGTPWRETFSTWSPMETAFDTLEKSSRTALESTIVLPTKMVKPLELEDVFHAMRNTVFYSGSSTAIDPSVTSPTAHDLLPWNKIVPSPYIRQTFGKAEAHLSVFSHIFDFVADSKMWDKFERYLERYTLNRFIHGRLDLRKFSSPDTSVIPRVHGKDSVGYLNWKTRATTTGQYAITSFNRFDNTTNLLYISTDDCLGKDWIPLAMESQYVEVINDKWRAEQKESVEGKKRKTEGRQPLMDLTYFLSICGPDIIRNICKFLVMEPLENLSLIKRGTSFIRSEKDPWLDEYAEVMPPEFCHSHPNVVHGSMEAISRMFIPNCRSLVSFSASVIKTKPIVNSDIDTTYLSTLLDYQTPLCTDPAKHYREGFGMSNFYDGARPLNQPFEIASHLKWKGALYTARLDASLANKPANYTVYTGNSSGLCTPEITTRFWDGRILLPVYNPLFALANTNKRLRAIIMGADFFTKLKRELGAEFSLVYRSGKSTTELAASNPMKEREDSFRTLLPAMPIDFIAVRSTIQLLYKAWSTCKETTLGYDGYLRKMFGYSLPEKDLMLRRGIIAAFLAIATTCMNFFSGSRFLLPPKGYFECSGCVGLLTGLSPYDCPHFTKESVRDHTSPYVRTYTTRESGRNPYDGSSRQHWAQETQDLHPAANYEKRRLIVVHRDSCTVPPGLLKPPSKRSDWRKRTATQQNNLRADIAVHTPVSALSDDAKSGMCSKGPWSSTYSTPTLTSMSTIRSHLGDTEFRNNLFSLAPDYFYEYAAGADEIRFKNPLCPTCLANGETKTYCLPMFIGIDKKKVSIPGIETIRLLDVKHRENSSQSWFCPYCDLCMCCVEKTWHMIVAFSVGMYRFNLRFFVQMVKPSTVPSASFADTSGLGRCSPTMLTRYSFSVRAHYFLEKLKKGQITALEHLEKHMRTFRSVYMPIRAHEDLIPLTPLFANAYDYWKQLFWYEVTKFGKVFVGFNSLEIVDSLRSP